MSQADEKTMRTAKQKATDFLRQNMMLSSQLDMESLCGLFIEEMNKGLSGGSSSLLMIPTYVEPKSAIPSGKPVIALDAGGTNLRAALIVFDNEKKPQIQGFRKAPMPGVKSAVTLEEFFAQIAATIGDLADKSDNIGFCFSYPTEIVESGDGRLLRFSKEIKAKEVEGQFIGANLNKALMARGQPGTKRLKSIVIVNDTVTTLLAGMSAFGDRIFDSYIGFILGTGTNSCYIEKNENITKLRGFNKSGEQVINIESGGFGKVAGGPIDVAFDNTTLNPGFYTFEKMISGAYLGGLFAVALKTAASAGLFSAPTGALLDALKTLQTSELGSFLTVMDAGHIHGKEASSTKVDGLASLFANEDERVIAQCIGEAIVDRAALLSAVNLASIALKTHKGQSAARPILTTADGTTFYELPGLRQKTLKYLDDFLTGTHGQHMEFARVDNAPLIGAAIAGLSRG